MRFSCTVSHGKTEPCCEITMPFGLGPSSTAPSTRALPSSGRSKPAMMFMSVDLPHPEGPTMATNSPSATEKLTPSITWSLPFGEGKLFFRFSTTILLPDIAPPHRLEPLEEAHDPVEHEADHADDDHAGDHEIVAVAGVARIHDEVAEPRVQRDHLRG